MIAHWLHLLCVELESRVNLSFMKSDDCVFTIGKDFARLFISALHKQLAELSQNNEYTANIKDTCQILVNLVFFPGKSRHP